MNINTMPLSYYYETESTRYPGMLTITFRHFHKDGSYSFETEGAHNMREAREILHRLLNWGCYCTIFSVEK